MKNHCNWNEHVRVLSRCLAELACTTDTGAGLKSERAFELWQQMTLDIRASRHTVFLAGNGASASMASHMSADLAKNAQVHTEVFSDLSLITAISNDMGYEHVFSEPLSRRARAGDMLVAISSSGRSPNVLAAAREALKKKMSIVTLTAMHPENPLRRMGTLNFYIAAKTYGFAESGHASILHHWMDLVEAGKDSYSPKGKK